MVIDLPEALLPETVLLSLFPPLVSAVPAVQPARRPARVTDAPARTSILFRAMVFASMCSSVCMVFGLFANAEEMVRGICLCGAA